MNIGIGVTTYRREKHLALWKQQVSANLPPNAKIHIAEDTFADRKGVAARKNECLAALKDCDFIFLFDDDCFPIRDGFDNWWDFFIATHYRTKQHHFLYMKATGSIKEISFYNDIRSFNNCGGCFMFLTQEVIQKVGGFCKDYGYYGFEHAGYSKRIHLAGLTPMGEYLTPSGAGKHIYAMDYDNYLHYNRSVNHSPSLVNELSKVDEYVSFNHQVFLKDIQNIYQPI